MKNFKYIGLAGVALLGVSSLLVAKSALAIEKAKYTILEKENILPEGHGLSEEELAKPIPHLNERSETLVEMAQKSAFYFKEMPLKKYGDGKISHEFNYVPGSGAGFIVKKNSFQSVSDTEIIGHPTSTIKMKRHSGYFLNPSSPELERFIEHHTFSV